METSGLAPRQSTIMESHSAAALRGFTAKANGSLTNDSVIFFLLRCNNSLNNFLCTTIHEVGFGFSFCFPSGNCPNILE